MADVLPWIQNRAIDLILVALGSMWAAICVVFFTGLLNDWAIYEKIKELRPKSGIFALPSIKNSRFLKLIVALILVGGIVVLVRLAFFNSGPSEPTNTLFGAGAMQVPEEGPEWTGQYQVFVSNLGPVIIHNVSCTFGFEGEDGFRVSRRYSDPPGDDDEQFFIDFPHRFDVTSLPDESTKSLKRYQITITYVLPDETFSVYLQTIGAVHALVGECSSSAPPPVTIDWKREN